MKLLSYYKKKESWSWLKLGVNHICFILSHCLQLNYKQKHHNVQPWRTFQSVFFSASCSCSWIRPLQQWLDPLPQLSWTACLCDIRFKVSPYLLLLLSTLNVPIQMWITQPVFIISFSNFAWINLSPVLLDINVEGLLPKAIFKVVFIAVFLIKQDRKLNF